jgi:hypothetical protein
MAPASSADALDWLSSESVRPLPRYEATVGSEAPNGERQALSVGPPPLPASFTRIGTATPPPLRLPPPLPPMLLSVEDEEPTPAATDVVPAAPPPPPEPTELVDPLLEAAETGPARCGLCTRRALYKRIIRTRRLLRLWNELGRFLNAPKRRLHRATEGPQLLSLLEEITTLLQKFPPLLGEAGQPGYLVLALTQMDTIKVFQSFSAHQREALSRDWAAGYKLLSLHRDFLRRELRAMRKRTFRQRFVRAILAGYHDQPLLVFVFLLLLALNLFLWQRYIEVFWDKIFSP